jgi:hypothetical protein
MRIVHKAVQEKPRKTKDDQTKPNKNAWIDLVLFVRIGTFQWVTRKPNKKSRFLPTGSREMRDTHGCSP